MSMTIRTAIGTADRRNSREISLDEPGNKLIKLKFVRE